MEYSKPVFEVLNFGKPGADTDTHVKFLANSMAHIDADFVILQWFVNDVRNDQDLRYSTTPLIPWPPLHRFMVSRSALFYLLDYGWIQLQHYLGIVESEDDFMIRHFGDADSWRTRRAQDLSLDFIEICRRNNLPVGIILFPALNREQPLGFLLDRVLAVCIDQQVSCVDLRETFASVKDPSSLTVNQFDSHPNRCANELAARAVLDAFGTQWAAHADRILGKIDQPGGESEVQDRRFPGKLRAFDGSAGPRGERAAERSRGRGCHEAVVPRGFQPEGRGQGLDRSRLRADGRGHPAGDRRGAYRIASVARRSAGMGRRRARGDRCAAARVRPGGAGPPARRSTAPGPRSGCSCSRWSTRWCSA